LSDYDTRKIIRKLDEILSKLDDIERRIRRLERSPLTRQPRHQVLHAPVALDRVAVAAEQLQVAEVVRAALRPRYDMVYRQVPRLEVRLAARAVAFLLVVEPGPVLRGRCSAGSRPGRCAAGRPCGA
jgi:hypothetical protein